MTRRTIPLMSVLLALALGGCQATTKQTSTSATGTEVAATATPAQAAPAKSVPAPPAEPPIQTIEGGLRYQDLRVGDGAIAETGMMAVVHYTGRFTDGRKFDSSHDRGEPYPVRIGAGSVIRGWDLGLVGMRVGGMRKLICPPEYAYGAEGREGIPPNATLIFELELVDLR
jgi:FKBP-type peptidyl-prolyl cis-trans isomerase